jgi:hypothetical protein
VQDQQLRKQELRATYGGLPLDERDIKLFIYDLRRAQSRAVTYGEARRLVLYWNSYYAPDSRSNGFWLEQGIPPPLEGEYSAMDTVFLRGWGTRRPLNIKLAYSRSDPPPA